jgi:hypothetical protein
VWLPPKESTALPSGLTSSAYPPASVTSQVDGWRKA